LFFLGKVDEGDAVIDSNVLPYCSIDQKKEKKSVGELEQEFLQALQVYICHQILIFFFR
jgi:predicted nucleic acid-binding protein